jgi:hypothetical protein
MAGVVAVPSPDTVQRNAAPWAWRQIRAWDALAYLAVFCSASRQQKYTAASMSCPNRPNQAAGRHRRVRSRPVGKSRNTKASMASGITQIQLDSHMAARAAGHDPGAATRPCSP